MVTVSLVATLLGGALLGGQRGLAQDASAGHPAHIHTGTCNELGDVVAPLSDLTAPAGDPVGQKKAIVAEGSYTNVPLALDAILADDHSINVHLSADEIATYIACGEIGGVLDANGALAIGLKELNNSGYTGIAYLSPADDGTTNVSVFISSAKAGKGGGDEAATDETPAADDTAAETPVADDAGEETQVVDVSLTEWSIEMPDTLAAGPITFNITNNGSVQHNLEIEGNGVEEKLDANLAPGESGTLEVTLEAGTYEVYCPVGDGSHREQGMELELTVE
jgi:uncharacterized cupredoxin-like copper-binding protein